MLNYIRAEFYKVLHRKYLYATQLVLLLCAGLLVAGWAFTNANGNHVDFATGGSLAVSLLGLGVYAPIVVGDMVFSDQYKFNTLKNEVSFGLPRARIYLGKLAVAAVVGVAMLLLTVGFYEGLCWLLLEPSAPGDAGQILTIVGYCLLADLPQFLGMMALTNMIYFLIRSNTMGAFLAAGIMAVPPMVLDIMSLLTAVEGGLREALLTLNSWMPQNMVAGAYKVVGDWGFMAKSWVLGLVWMGVCTALGLWAFHKKEIN